MIITLEKQFEIFMVLQYVKCLGLLDSELPIWEIMSENGVVVCFSCLLIILSDMAFIFRSLCCSLCLEIYYFSYLYFMLIAIYYSSDIHGSLANSYNKINLWLVHCLPAVLRNRVMVMKGGEFVPYSTWNFSFVNLGFVVENI